MRILDTDREAAETVAGEIVACGGNAAAFPCDVANQQEVTDVFAKLFQNDCIQILVNNAGISHVGNLEWNCE